MNARQPRGRPAHADVLTPAEWRAVEGVRHGLSNGRIALHQGVSINAVKFHVSNVLLKLGFGSRTELRRWDGVRADSALKHRRNTMTGTLALGPLAQVSRTVSNMEGAKLWYRDKLGLELLFAFSGMAFFRLGDTRLYLHESDKPAAESALYFKVDDIHGAQGVLAERGIEFINAPHMIHRHPDGSEEWLAEFRDPDNRPLALMSRTRASATD